MQTEIEAIFDNKPAAYTEEHFALFARFVQLCAVCRLLYRSLLLEKSNTNHDEHIRSNARYFGGAQMAILFARKVARV